MIRRARRKDRHGIDACNRRCLSENYEMKILDYILCNHPGLSQVCVVGTKVVGYVLCDADNIVSVAVDKAYRLRGYARDMLQRCLSEIDALETPPTCTKLHVRVTNGIIELYKKLGFVSTKRIFAYYKNPNEDGFEMERRQIIADASALVPALVPAAAPTDPSATPALIPAAAPTDAPALVPVADVPTTDAQTSGDV